MKTNEKRAKFEQAAHIIEIEQKVEEGVGTLNDSVRVTCFILTRVTGSEAYRRFDYWHSAPIRNFAGSYRGVVRSRRWRIAFDKLGRVSAASKVFGEGLDAMAVVLEFARRLLTSWHLMRTEMRSGDTWDTKSAKIATQIVSICLRSATLEWKSMILGGLSVAGWAGNKMGRDIPLLNSWLQSTDVTRARIDSWSESVTDGDNIYRIVNTYVNLPLESRILPSYPLPREHYMQYNFRRKTVGF